MFKMKQFREREGPDEDTTSGGTFLHYVLPPFDDDFQFI